MTNQQIEEIYNFLQLYESVATAGQPTREQFEVIKKSCYQVVINLALQDSPNALPNEKEIVESQGMQYAHIPVVWDNPKLEDIERFFSVMKASEDKNIFVHCAANMRVSAFMYLYRRLHENLDEEKAKKDLNQIWIPNETWQQFIKKVLETYQK